MVEVHVYMTEIQTNLGDTKYIQRNYISECGKGRM